jgi:hypothetical protein
LIGKNSSPDDFFETIRLLEKIVPDDFLQTPRMDLRQKAWFLPPANQGPGPRVA